MSKKLQDMASMIKDHLPDDDDDLDENLNTLQLQPTPKNSTEKEVYHSKKSPTLPAVAPSLTAAFKPLVLDKISLKETEKSQAQFKAMKDKIRASGFYYMKAQKSSELTSSELFALLIEIIKNSKQLTDLHLLKKLIAENDPNVLQASLSDSQQKRLQKIILDHPSLIAPDNLSPEACGAKLHEMSDPQTFELAFRSLIRDYGHSVANITSLTRLLDENITAFKAKKTPIAEGVQASLEQLLRKYSANCKKMASLALPTQTVDSIIAKLRTSVTQPITKRWNKVGVRKIELLQDISESLSNIQDLSSLAQLEQYLYSDKTLTAAISAPSGLSLFSSRVPGETGETFKKIKGLIAYKRLELAQQYYDAVTNPTINYPINSEYDKKVKCDAQQPNRIYVTAPYFSNSHKMVNLYSHEARSYLCELAGKILQLKAIKDNRNPKRPKSSKLEVSWDQENRRDVLPLYEDEFEAFKVALTQKIIFFRDIIDSSPVYSNNGHEMIDVMGSAEVLQQIANTIIKLNAIKGDRKPERPPSSKLTVDKCSNSYVLTLYKEEYHTGEIGKLWKDSRNHYAQGSQASLGPR